MSRRTNVLGVVFLTLGIVLAIAVAAVMLWTRTLNIAGVIGVSVGVGCAILGALFIEPDAAKVALTSLGSGAAPFIPFSGHRDKEPQG